MSSIFDLGLILGVLLLVTYCESRTYGKRSKPDYMDLEPIDYDLEPVDIDAAAWTDEKKPENYIVKLSFSSNQQNDIKKISIPIKTATTSTQRTLMSSTYANFNSVPKDFKIIREENSLSTPWPIVRIWPPLNEEKKINSSASAKKTLSTHTAKGTASASATATIFPHFFIFFVCFFLNK